MRSALLRTSILVVALGAALSAQAFSLNVTSTGAVSGNYYGTGNAVLAIGQQTVGLEPLTFSHIHLQGFADSYVSGYAYYESANGSFTAIFQSPGVGGSDDGGLFFTGTWVSNVTGTFLGSTGIYSGYEGGGTFKLRQNNGRYPGRSDYIYDMTLELNGTFSEPVPEPASMAALSLGVAAFGRRRKRVSEDRP